MLKYEFSIDQQEDEDLRCPICNYYFSNTTKPYLLPCSHNLCITCIDNIILKKMFNCPICRKGFQEEDRKNFQVNFAFLNLVIKILKTKVIFCNKCSKIYNWVDHHQVCSQTEFKETNEIYEELKKLAEDCLMIIRYFDKHKNILHKSKKSIYESTNDIIKIINLKFYENFDKVIDSFFKNIPDMNFENYLREMFKYIELCKPFGSMMNLNLVGYTPMASNYKSQIKSNYKTINPLTHSDNVAESVYDSLSNSYVDDTNVGVKKVKKYSPGDCNNYSSNYVTNSKRGTVNPSLSTSPYHFKTDHKPSSKLREYKLNEPSKRFSEVKTGNLNKTADSISKVNNFNIGRYLLHKPQNYEENQYENIKNHGKNQSDDEEGIVDLNLDFNPLDSNRDKQEKNHHSRMNSEFNESVNHNYVSDEDNNHNKNVKINPPKNLNMNINKNDNLFLRNSIDINRGKSNEQNSGEISQNNNAPAMNILNFNYNFQLTELIEDNMLSNSDAQISTTNKTKQKIVVRNDKIEYVPVGEKHSMSNSKNSLKEMSQSKPDEETNKQITNKSNSSNINMNINLNMQNISNSFNRIMIDGKQGAKKKQNEGMSKDSNTKDNLIKEKEKVCNSNRVSNNNVTQLNQINKNLLRTSQTINESPNKPTIETNQPNQLSPKSQYDAINKILVVYNKTKETVQRILNYTQQVEFTSESIRSQISTNYNYLNENITKSLNSLCDNITVNFNNNHRRFMINLIDNTKKIWLFDVRKMKCEIKEFILPFKLTNFSSIEFDDNDLMFISGGKYSSSLLDFDGKYSGVFIILRWSNKNIELNAHMPRKRAYHSSVYFENKLYVIGGAAHLVGNNVGNIKDCECYNIIDKRWELMPSMNAGRCNPSLCVYNGSYLYAFRGWNFTGNKEDHSYLDTIEFLNIKHITLGWTLIKPEDPGMTWGPCINSVATVLGENKIFICGGSQSKDNSKMTNSTFIFDPLKKSVYRSKDLVKASVFNTAGTIYENNLIIIDFKNETSKPFGVHIYDIENKIWKFNQS